jgi:hypothetical protein
MISADDRSLLRLFVLIRAANERVAKERLLAEVERRNIRGFTATALRGIVSSLVRTAALDAGLEVTALHNHFFYESPRVMYMHIGGSGAAEQLAPVVKKVLDTVKSVRTAAPVPPNRFAGDPIPEASTISVAALDAIFGVKGKSNNGMHKATIGRAATMHGAKVGKQMGVNTWAAFAGTDSNSLVDGDFAMTTDELQPVLKALRKSGINIVAIHNHMTHEEPQDVFLHYWGKGPATTLARGLRSALDTQGR